MLFHTCIYGMMIDVKNAVSAKKFPAIKLIYIEG